MPLEKVINNWWKFVKQQKINESFFKPLEPLINEDPAAQDTTYELKLFVMPARCSISKSLGGDKTDTFNEIRGILGVTTVTDALGTVREDDKNYYSTILIKFELLVGKGPLDYRTKILIPGIKKVKGMVVYNIGDINQVAK